jgi:hypothetical protein
LSELALQPDPPAAEYDELSGERQPEAGVLDLLVRRPHLPEVLENRLLIAGGDADTSIGDGPIGEPSCSRALTSIRPPSGVNFKALDNRHREFAYRARRNRPVMRHETQHRVFAAEELSVGRRAQPAHVLDAAR